MRPGDDVVNAPEMIARFDDVIYLQYLVFTPNGVCFENKTRLFLREPAPLYVIGIVCQLNLCFVVDSPGESHLHLLSQNVKKRHWLFLFRPPKRNRSIFRYVPCFSRQKCSFYFADCTIVPSSTFGYAVAYGKLCGRYVFSRFHALILSFLAGIGKKYILLLSF